ncbi:MAG: polyphosphate polymerase domain-containing protein, partial [Lachnospiraceae bacterium]|nr:polyphosphate polymerase domain-containing protein [Lachnospiraceae bacterium]
NKNSCFEANTEGLDHRRKFRIRIYNRSSKRIRLEIKYKIHGMTKKESCPLTEEQCRTLMRGECLPYDVNDPKPLQALYLAMKTQGMHPVEIVEYERTAYVYPVGNVRVTFDRNISGSSYIEGFLDGEIPLIPVMPRGKHVLEVKFDELLPTYIAAVLDTGRLEQTAFSKYYLCRERLKNMS